MNASVPRTIQEVNPDYPPNLTRRMIALIRTFGDDKVKYPEEEMGITIPDFPEANFTRRTTGWNGFAIDLSGQLGLNTSTDDITARAAPGTLLDAVYNRVTASNTNGMVVILPAVLEGVVQYVVNSTDSVIRASVFARADGQQDFIETPFGSQHSFNIHARATAMFFTITAGPGGRIGMMYSSQDGLPIEPLP